LKLGLLNRCANREVTFRADRLANHTDERRILEIDLEYARSITSSVDHNQFVIDDLEIDGLMAKYLGEREYYLTFTDP
jgi:hypothetical protein